MISDILSETASAIDDYLEGMPDVYVGAMRQEIDALSVLINITRRRLDMSSEPSEEYTILLCDFVAKTLTKCEFMRTKTEP